MKCKILKTYDVPSMEKSVNDLLEQGWFIHSVAMGGAHYGDSARMLIVMAKDEEV